MAKKRTKGGGRIKRTFRKADIGDIEDAAEDERLITQLKSKQANPKPTKKGSSGLDEELFFFDTKASTQHLSRTSRRDIARAKIFPTKAANLGPSAAEEMRIARAEKCPDEETKASAKRAAAGPEVYDLWGAPAAKVARTGAVAFPGIRRSNREPIRAPKTLHQRVGVAPAVIPAHEGQSMNPNSDAYEDLVCSAAAKQLKKERDDKELDRQLAPMTNELREILGEDELKAMTEEEKVTKYREYLIQKGQEAADDSDDDGTYLSKKQRRQKTQAKKNRKIALKDQKARVSQEVAQQRLDKSVGEVGAILRDMKEEDKRQKARADHKKQIQAQQLELERQTGIVPNKRRFGGNRTKFLEQDAHIPAMGSAGNGLRSMPLTGSSAVQERISSIMRRGMLPAPPEANRYESEKRKKAINRVRGRKKFVSPLLRQEGSMINRRVGKAKKS